ncbi:MAG: hypothetical protein HRU19_21850 [Pseudobacteriovorax sp.]|nr:hypothetical protein [Pseudobacteriovorax sp.]
MINIFKWVLCGLASIAFGQKWAYACSSCGSGVVDPIILQANESHKFYLGTSWQDRIRDSDADGNLRRTAGVHRRSITTLSYALRFPVDSLTASLTVSNQSNIDKDGHQRTGLADPLATIRYELLRQSFVDPAIPAIQFVGSYKGKSGKSVHNTKHSRLLDVFSSGFAEVSIGSDIWFGMWPVKFGSSFFFTRTLPESKHNNTVRPGDRMTSILSLGSNWREHLKLNTGFIHREQKSLSDDTGQISNSDSHTLIFYASLESLSLPWGQIRFTASEEGSWYRKNSSSSRVLTLALIKGISK